MEQRGTGMDGNSVLDDLFCDIVRNPNRDDAVLGESPGLNIVWIFFVASQKAPVLAPDASGY